MMLAISLLEFAEMQKIVQNKQTNNKKTKKQNSYWSILGCKSEKLLSYLK